MRKIDFNFLFIKTKLFINKGILLMILHNKHLQLQLITYKNNLRMDKVSNMFVIRSCNKKTTF